MQNRLFFVVSLLAMLSAINGYGQKNFILSKLKNDSVKFKIFVTQWDDEKDEFFSRSYVYITSLDSTDWNEIRSLSRKDWIKLLHDPQYDWGANLALYELHRKEAYFFRSIDTRQEWLKRLREDDIKYWAEQLR